MNQKDLSENEIIKLRKAKLEAIRAIRNPFPNDFRRDSFSKDILDQFDKLSNEELEKENKYVSVAGRIRFKRIMGKAAFAHIQDPKGKIQLYIKKDQIGEQYDDFKQWDLGDIVGAYGRLFKTKTGELSVFVEKIDLVVKSVRPLPDKYHGLSDTELKYRQRYLDLIVNEKTKDVFHDRFTIITSIRQFLYDHKFMEVETPMMQQIPGGAAAKPFITHHNALDMKLYLRIAPELYLKRLVIGGLERVFEMNKNFRNEGISTTHNPEFSMLEFYMTYSDYNDLMDLTEKLLLYILKAVKNSPILTYQGKSVDLSKPYQRITLKDAALKYNPELSDKDYHNVDKLREYLQKKGFEVDHGTELGYLQYELFEQTAEDRLEDPTFVTEFPTAVSPLARKNEKNPDVVDRFELFICGKELANGFSELNDPVDQASRFDEQAKERAKGDDEAMYYDEDYVKALEYGLPPTAGEGIGVDRLIMLFTDTTSIKDVILFPQLRSNK